jgi:histidinol dehydrogenase
MVSIGRLDTRDSAFWNELEQLLAWESVSDERVHNTVRDIIDDVRQRGDQALLHYTNLFDRLSLSSIDQCVVVGSELQASLKAISSSQRKALEQAAVRITAYAERQKLQSWAFTEQNGTLLGQQINALDRAGLYVPGGKAAYPSSVLMNAIPAKVAGVSEVVMVVPTPDGVKNDMVFAAAAVAGVDKVITIGGAQAIAALAYGTKTVPAVDKIVGPGNIYVATAKRQVFGKVGIDMIAGPSEICIICDGKTNPDWIALDLFSQAEHDENAQSILLSWDESYLQDVKNSIDKLISEMPRASIIEQSLRDRGALIKVADINEAIKVANYIAPEHLELSIDGAADVAPQIRHAGAIFMGRYTAEALGDYCAGPNHVLPTSGTARFSSPLGVYDFQKRTSLIDCSADGASALGKIASVLAHGEGLTAHARSAEARIK